MLNLCQASAMAAIFAVGVTLAGRAEAQSKYGPGVTDKEIKLGTYNAVQRSGFIF